MSNIKNLIKNCSGKILGVYPEKMKEIIADAEIVSFDIFDTLVKRNVPVPQDIFSVVEEIYNSNSDIQINDYREERIKAETRARQISREEEIDINGIYGLLNYSEKAKRQLMEIELETEINNCVPDLTMQRIYNFAQEMGKHIIITSDMYLPEDTLKRILFKCGYAGYEKLYLSSVYKKTKSSGSIFHLIIEDYNNAAEKIVHIGDNIKGDFIRPKEKHMKAILVDGNKNKLNFWSKSCKEFKLSADYRSMYSFINNNVDEYAGVSQKIGYEVLGPILYGFCNWLNNQIRQDNIDKIFFLSREGKLLQRAYGELFPNSSIPQRYLMVSRQALLVSMLYKVKCYDELVETLKCFMHIPQLKTICTVCSLDDARFRKELDQLGLSEETEIYKVPDNLKKDVYGIINKLGESYFRRQYEYVHKYLRDNDFAGNIGIVDIGWTGTMQRCLKSFTDDNTVIAGYYLGVKNLEKENFYNGIQRKGYLFQPGHNKEYSLMIRFTLQIFETLFLNQDGSVRKYRLQGDKIVPDCADSEYGTEEGKLIYQIQECAVKLLQKSVENCYKRDISAEYIMHTYSSFAVKPKLSILKLFKNFSFLDGNTITLLPQHSIFYYIMHLKQFSKELNTNVCKVWFLKWLFKIRFPYYNILKAASNAGLKSNFVGKFYDKKI